MIVRAKAEMVGFFGDRRYYGTGCKNKRAGEKFAIPDKPINKDTGLPRAFSLRWMEIVKATPVEEQKANRVLRDFQEAMEEDRRLAKERKGFGGPVDPDVIDPEEWKKEHGVEAEARAQKEAKKAEEAAANDHQYGFDSAQGSDEAKALEAQAKTSAEVIAEEQARQESAAKRAEPVMENEAMYGNKGQQKNRRNKVSRKKAKRSKRSVIT